VNTNSDRLIEEDLELINKIYELIRQDSEPQQPLAQTWSGKQGLYKDAWVCIDKSIM
jgi:hypothetical protein